MSENSNWIEALKSKLPPDQPPGAPTQATSPLILAPFTKENATSGIYLGTVPGGPSWPHSIRTNDPKIPGFGPKGFLDPRLVYTSEFTLNKKPDALPENLKEQWQDWRGFTLKEEPYTLDTKDRVQKTKDFPKTAQQLVEKPYSMRDIPLIFGDSRQDYFKHGLEILNGKNPIENPPDGQSTLRLDQFKSTPFEQNDPVMFGFDIIFDNISSPLLNGSILDFIANYNGVDEIFSRRHVYEEFRYQFSKFFRTKTPMRINKDFIVLTRGDQYPNLIAPNSDGQSNLKEPGKRNYLGYYIKKIEGLDFLIEQNKGDTIKYVPDYKKDLITIETIEDVTLSMGTLAHLYKNLYWSKPNGRILFPENLLRFNCQIIVSECRNFNRVKKGSTSGNLNFIKDNVSRWVYDLKECQFYFDKMPVPNAVDIGGQGPQVFDSFTINFDFKYSTVKFERFIPSGDWGRYVGFDAGAMWKVGNPGGRSTGASASEYSQPKFFTIGPNDDKSGTKFIDAFENGVDKPVILKVIPTQPSANKDSGSTKIQDDNFSLEDEKGPPGKDGQPTNGNEIQNQVQVAGTTPLTPTTSSLDNLEKLSKLKSEQIKVQKEELELANARNLLGGLQNVGGQTLNGTGQNNEESQLENLRKRGRNVLGGIQNFTNDARQITGQVNQLATPFFNVMNQVTGNPSSTAGARNFLGQATSFINQASGVVNTGVNLSNQLNQLSTRFFNTMGENNNGGGGFRNFLSQATGFVNQVSNVVNTGNALSNQLNQVSTQFFNTMGQNGGQGFGQNIGSLINKSTSVVNGGVGNFLNQATSFVQSGGSQVQNFANQITQQSTQFFNTMGQNGGKGFGANIGGLINKGQEIFSNVGGVATNINNNSSNASSNLRTNLLNKTINKAYGPKQSGATGDLKSELKDFLGGTLGDLLG
jgi:hypothetical protein